jgi:hypothetical protein
MNTYERIINILLEARVEMFIQDRLDEAKAKPKPKPSEAQKTASKFAEPNLGAKALSQAAQARKKGDKAGAREQLGRAKKLDKPQLP